MQVDSGFRVQPWPESTAQDADTGWGPQAGDSTESNAKYLVHTNMLFLMAINQFCFSLVSVDCNTKPSPAPSQALPDTTFANPTPDSPAEHAHASALKASFASLQGQSGGCT